MDQYLCIDGPRVTALLPVDGEEPAAIGIALRAGMYQSQASIPHDSQHSIILFLGELTRLLEHRRHMTMSSTEAFSKRVQERKYIYDTHYVYDQEMYRTTRILVSQRSQ